MHYIVKGKGEKTLLFLHGWGGSCASMMPLIDSLSDTYRCIAPDFYGHGQTSAEHVYFLHDFVDGVKRILEKERAEQVVVIAHSFGGRVALELAIEQRIKALVIMAGAGVKPRPTAKKLARKCKYALKKLLRRDLSDCGSPDFRALSPLMKRTFVNIVNTYQDDALCGIKKPVLLIWGKKDRDTPPYMAHKMHKGISASRLIVLSGGHFCYLDHAFEVAGYIRNFLNGVYYGVDSGGSGRHIGRGDGNARNGVDPACGIQDKPQ